MRNSKLFALGALGLLAASSAIAGDQPQPLPLPLPLPPLPQIQDFYVVANTPTAEMLCIVSDPTTVGLPVMILADGSMPVAMTVLLPGPNLIMVPQTDAVSFMAMGGEIQGRSVLQGGLGLN